MTVFLRNEWIVWLKILMLMTEGMAVRWSCEVIPDLKILKIQDILKIRKGL